MLPYGERSASRDQVLGGFSTALAIDKKFLPLRPCRRDCNRLQNRWHPTFLMAIVPGDTTRLPDDEPLNK
jgi:hypothetical protein